MSAVTDFVEQEKSRQQKITTKIKKDVISLKRKNVTQSAIILFAILVTSFQIYGGGQSTNYIEDLPFSEQLIHRCLANFWKISELLKNGEALDEKLRCPVTNEPYMIENIGGFVVVHDPSPEIHGYSSIWMSSDWTQLVLEEFPNN